MNFQPLVSPFTKGLAGLALAWFACESTAADTMLDSLAEMRAYETARISSFDRSGGNGDRMTIEPGQTAVMADIEGAGIIKHIWITIAHKDSLYRRNMILRMYWDGEEHPSVEAPVGDFFGQGWGQEYLFSSMPLAAGPNGGKALNCYFPMPFGKGARITMENQSKERCDALYFYVDYEKHKKMDKNQLRFHAWWNREITKPWKGDENEWDTLRPADKNPTDENNYIILDAKGKGHYVGVNYYVDCPTAMWYGEGDDMWQIDGEAWPFSLHGTGTEDYFNSSWCPTEPFNHPYFGYAKVANRLGWMGRTHSYRFHIQDPIVFHNSLKGSIEHGHANNLTLDLSTVAYWYQTEPHKVFPALPGPEDRKPMPEIGVAEIHRWRDAWREKNGADILWGNERK